MTVQRVEITPAATAFVEKLKALHRDLLFHQSGGCCDGSAPMCYPRGEFRVGGSDVFRGRSRVRRSISVGRSSNTGDTHI